MQGADISIIRNVPDGRCLMRVVCFRYYDAGSSAPQIPHRKPMVWNSSALILCDRQQAIAGLVDRTREYSAALVNERVPTRLGDGSVDVEVNGQLISPFTGERIKALSIRGNWLSNAEPGSMAKVVSIEATGRATLDVDGIRFHYDVEGLHRA